MNEYTTGNDLHDGDYGTSRAALFTLFSVALPSFFFSAWVKEGKAFLL